MRLAPDVAVGVILIHLPFTVFDLITAHIPISAQSSNFVIFKLQPVYFLSTSLKRRGYPFELHRLVNAIQMGTHNICYYKENQ